VTAVAPPPAVEPELSCPRCGAGLRPDQEWCLNCGAAVATRVAGSSGWKTPVAIVAGVLVLAAAALLVAFLELSDDAEQAAQVPPAQTPAAAPPAATPAPPAPTPAATASPSATATPSPAGGSSGEVGTWPAGESAWTVVLLSTTRKADADRRARSLAREGKSVGVLDSDDFSSLRGGYWVVFSGQYEDAEKAAAAAKTLAAGGSYVRRVTPR